MTHFFGRTRGASLGLWYEEEEDSPYYQLDDEDEADMDEANNFIEPDPDDDIDPNPPLTELEQRYNLYY